MSVLESVLKDNQQDTKYLKITDFDNYFNVYLDKNGNYTFNLNQTLYFDATQLSEYKCDCRMFWPLISFKLYDTTRFAWLLIKLNNVKGKDIFKAKNAGDIVYFIDKKQLQSIIPYINGYDTTL